MKTPWIIAHRGASGDAPENTALAFREALRQKTEVVEFDIHATREGKFVIIHDATINRTSDGEGFVHLLTFKHLRKFNYGTLRKPQRILTLEEGLRLVTPQAIALVELKLSVEGHERKVLNILRKFPQERIWIHTSHQPILKEIRRLHPTLRLGYIVLLTIFQQFFLPEEALFAKRWGISFFSIDEELINKPFVQKMMEVLKKNNVESFVWVVDSRKTMKEMIGLGVDGIITDYPRKLRTLLHTLQRVHYKALSEKRRKKRKKQK